MDELDRKLMSLIERNPRATYRSLADQLEISIPTVWERVEGLTSSGRLGPIRCSLSPMALGASVVHLFGTAQTKLTKSVLDGLGDEGSILRVFIGMHDRVFCIFLLEKAGNIDKLIKFLERRIGLTDYQVLVPYKGMDMVDGQYYDFIGSSAKVLELKESDIRILHSLCEDGRKCIAEISKESGLSPKTVRRRLDRMIQNDMIRFRLSLNMGLEEDVWFNLLVEFSSTSSRDAIIMKLVRSGYHCLDEATFYLNRPELALMDGLAQTTAELKQLTNSLLMEDGVQRVLSDIIIHTQDFDTWTHRISRGELPLPKPTK
jgi:DNA-binding Lrp family transcriptional regulator